MPTGLATTGSPAAMYCSTFSPHLPRLQVSSGSQLMPMSPPARSAASVADDQRPGTTSHARQLRQPVADHSQLQPGQIARPPRPGAAGHDPARQRARLADPDQPDAGPRRRWWAGW